MTTDTTAQASDLTPNGVDTTALFATSNRGQAHPRRRQDSSSCAHNQWVSGTHTTTIAIVSVRSARTSALFVFDATTPGGPGHQHFTSFVLHALAACLTAGISPTSPPPGGSR